MTLVARKICLIGDFGVGKTSLIQRFIDRSFSDRYLTTVGVKISRKLVSLEKGVEVQLIIWDLEGQSKFQSITPTYLQGAAGALIVADASRPHTIDSISQHCRTFLQVNPLGAIVAAVNKIDLVTTDQVQDIKSSLSHSSYPLAMTSAKTGQEVDKIFYHLSHVMIEKTP